MKSGSASRLCAGLVLCVLAVAVSVGHGQEDRATATRTVEGVDYVLLIDATGTMRYQGRAEATLLAIAELIDSTQPGDRISVFGYGEEPFSALTAYPVTVESERSKADLIAGIELSFGADRTDITRGLEHVWTERASVLPQAGASDAARAACVILLTDGKLIPNYDDYSVYDSIYQTSRRRLLELGDLFGELGTPVHTITLGSEEKTDGELMSAVSRRSGGSHYAAHSSGVLANVFGSVVDEMASMRQERVAGAGYVTQPDGTAGAAGEEGATPATSDFEGSGAQTEEGSWVVYRASAEQTEPAGGATRSPGQSTTDNRGMAAASAAFRDSAMATVHQTTVGILGVIMGFVAIGIQRRQSWTRTFTKPLLKKEIRVKGYLKPIYPEGVVGAKSAIPIENPGLPVVEIGAGTQYASDANHTLVEFVGTVDGTPPLVRVLRGEVRIGGETVTDERQLEDGDVLEFEDRAYEYLRGSRR